MRMVSTGCKAVGHVHTGVGGNDHLPEAHIHCTTSETHMQTCQKHACFLYVSERFCPKQCRKRARNRIQPHPEGPRRSTPVNTIGEVCQTPLVSGFRSHAHPRHTCTARDPQINAVPTLRMTVQTASWRCPHPTRDRLPWENLCRGRSICLNPEIHTCQGVHGDP